MAKAKFNMKEFLLKRGELLVMGVAGFFLAIFLLWGASMWGSANPTPSLDEMERNSKAVYTAVKGDALTEEDKKSLKPPEWVEKPYVFKTASTTVFGQSKQPIFDPVAQPSTKRENPLVLTIGNSQVDLIRGAIIGFDFSADAAGNPLIAVLTTKTTSKLDDKAIATAADTLQKARDKNKRAKQFIPVRPQVPPPAQKGPPGAVVMQPGMNPHGLQGGQFNQDGQRVEKAIKYIPLNEIDKALKEGNLPALTVIPLRMVTVHAVVPYKKQVEEIKRALRLPIPSANATQQEKDASDAYAKQWGPWYDGFEVQRRVTKGKKPNGEDNVIQDWPPLPKDPNDTSGNYLFEERYIEKIDTRKVGDHFDDGYIPYFLKPELMLAMPLPRLAEGLNVKYPKIDLKEINDDIDRLVKASQKPPELSEIYQQIHGKRARDKMYMPRSGGDAVLGPEREKYGPTFDPKRPLPKGPIGPGVVNPLRPGLGTPKLPEGFEGNANVVTVNEVENFLLRFVDCDVDPGYTYEYRIRLRMVNPNYGQTELVANPEYAKDSYKFLYSKWLTLGTMTPEGFKTKAIDIPAESFLYANDVKSYRDQVNTTYPTSSPTTTDEVKQANNYLNKLLQVKDDQVVVQVATWMEQVQAGDSTKREPVGNWVVAEMPVGRGEFVGRKQIIRLPLWSSESQQYVLREITDKVVKGKYQPKGWLVDFSTQSVLVDFEGGKVKTKSSVRFDEKGSLIQGSRSFDEDVASELLMVRADGKLVVRSSQEDDDDPVRKENLPKWSDWVKQVEQNKAPGTTGEPNPFDPKK